MHLTVFSGPANPRLAERVAARLGVRLAQCLFERFPDSEGHVRVGESVRGDDVYLIQPTGPPVDASVLELLFLADACRRAGAARVTAVVPYFGYARQDRRASGREPVGARLIADLIGTTGIRRLVAVDLHTAALEGFFPIPLEHLSAVPLLAETVRASLPDNTVIVAPDLGAVRLAERYASLLHRPVAVIHKIRISAEEVGVRGIVGDVRGHAPLIVDDMISTGGTIDAAINALLAAGCAPEISVVASHALLVGPAIQRLHALPVRRFVGTDSVAEPAVCGLPLQIVGLGPLLADSIERLHGDRSLTDLIMRA